MKKVLSICLILLLLSAAASAQRRAVNVRVRSAAITAKERLQLQRDAFRYRILQRTIRRDGIVTQPAQRQLSKIKRKTCREAIRFRHNSRNRG